MSVETDANTVLRKLVYSPTQNPKTLYYSRDLEFDQDLRDYKYCVLVFKFIETNFKEFITFLNGSYPSAHIHMKIGMEKEIINFLDEGGCEEFKNYSDFKIFIKEQKETKQNTQTINIHAPITGNITQLQDLNLEGVNTALKIENIKTDIIPTHQEPPTVKPVGSFNQFINWCTRYIWVIILGAAGSLLATFLQLRYHLFLD